MASVPNSIKEAMLQINLGNAAMVLELMALLGYFAGDNLSFSALIDLAQLEGIPTSPGIIRRGLAQLVKHGLIAWRPVRTKTPGRPTLEYKMASWFSIAKMLGIELRAQEHCDSPGENGFKSLKNYRKGLYYTYIKLRPGKYSRRFLGARLGIKKRTTWNYEQGTDIRITHNWDNEELGFFSLKYAPKTKQYDKFFIVSWDSEFKDKKVLPYTEFILRRELSQGRRVFKTWQTTNDYQAA